jgi:membrane fusion protein (multidrug efflux system)
VTPSSDTNSPEAAVPAASEAEAPGKAAAGAKKGLGSHPLLLWSAGFVLLVLLIAVLLWWLHARHFESTDDAFVDTHIVRLATQISGQVIAVPADDNALVAPGQPLVLIDSADAKARVAQAIAQQAAAQAQVANARAQIQVSNALYAQSRADIAAARAPAQIASLDLARYQNLLSLNPAAVASQQLDQAQTTAQQTAAQLEAALQASQMRLAQVGANHALLLAGEKQVEVATAQLDEAGISLGYARIGAPVAGHVTQRGVAVGDYVQPGTQLLAIVPLQLWVTANFKETQVARMRAGQPVTIQADACPSARLTGHLDSIQRGAGQAFAILPPENATGNYVKVVQRVPVKIVLDSIPGDCLLGPGMSVEPKIRVR